MEPITAIVTALALGAAAALKEGSGQAVKDTYAAVKELIQQKYGHISLSQLEEKPECKNRRALVEGELAAAGAERDEVLLRKVKETMDAVQNYAPQIAAAIGIDMEDVKAGSVRVADIVASGSASGLKVRRLDVSGPVIIEGVHVGGAGVDPLNEPQGQISQQQPIALTFQDISVGEGGLAVKIGISAERFQMLSEELGVTHAALRNFFKILSENQVAPEDLDHTLREIANRYNDLRQQLHSFSPEDPLVAHLKREAADALEAGDFEKTETCLNQASRRDLQIARELQEVAAGRLLSAAASKAQIGGLKWTQLAYSEAAARYDEAVQLVPATAALVLADYLNLSGSAYATIGDHEKAEQRLLRSIQLWEEAAELRPVELAATLANLADVYRVQGRYSEAEPLYHRCIKLNEKVFGPLDPHLESNMNDLAVVYADQGHYAQAELLYRRSLEIAEAIYGPERPEVARILFNLALIYEYQRRDIDAEPLLRRALEIEQKSFCADGRFMPQTFDRLAGLYARTAQHPKSEEFYRISLILHERVYGPHHLNTANALIGLANALTSQRRLSEAEPMLRRAFTILEQNVSPTHRQAGAAAFKIGCIYVAQGRYSEAESFLRQALTICDKSIGSDHLDTAVVLDRLSELYFFYLGLPSEAEPLLKRALRAREKNFGEEHAETARCVGDLGVFYISQRRWTDAESLIRRAKAVHENLFGHESPAVASDLMNLAMLYFTQNRYQEAEPLARSAVSIREKTSDNSALARALESYAGILDKLDREDDAKLIRDRVHAISESGR
jgi:tetratricopeptide (TPR) repeat protein